MKKEVEENIEKLCTSPTLWLDRFRQSEKWTGPSAYFHEQTLNRLEDLGGPLKATSDTRYQEYLYATLCAWGIHRMGPKPGRLVDFDKFCEQLEALSPYLGTVQGLHLDKLLTQQIDNTTAVLWNLIECMLIRPVEKPYLVPATKVLHHLLPELVVPIDGTYTTAFFGWSRNGLLDKPHNMFFEVFPLLADIARRMKPQVSPYVGQPFHRTLPKIVDNAIAGFMTSTKKNSKGATSEQPYIPEKSEFTVPSGSSLLGSSIKDADRIRQKAIELYFEPARQQGLKEVVIVSGKLHREVGLRNRYRNVCQVLGGGKLLQMAKAQLFEQEGPKDSSTTRFTYRLL